MIDVSIKRRNFNNKSDLTLIRKVYQIDCRVESDKKKNVSHVIRYDVDCSHMSLIIFKSRPVNTIKSLNKKIFVLIC